MEIMRLKGTDTKLYELIAPLVLSPAILRQNNNYPFKTTRRHVWYVAIEESQVEGFIPINVTEVSSNIDNYYIRGDRDWTIDRLLERIMSDRDLGSTLTAVVHKRHVTAFKRNGFRTLLEWKNYDKMNYRMKRKYVKAAERI